jgi:general secretion pathway protein I
MKSRGFTLLEVIIALFILAGTIIVLGTTWSGNFMRIRKSAMFNNVSTLLEQKMVEMEAKYKEKPLGEISESEDGDFGNDFPNYRWEMKSRDLKLPDLTPLLVGQEDGADETLISTMKQVTEYLSKVIKEVKVTIYVQSGKREVEFSATQYFVDYTQGFGGLPGGAGGTP